VRFEVFTAVEIQVEIFWVVMLCSVMVPIVTLHIVTTQKSST